MKLRMTNLTDEYLSTDIGNNLGEQIRVLLPPVGTVEVPDVDPFYINLDKVLRREVFQWRRIAYCFVPEPDDLVAPPFSVMTGVLAPARTVSTVNVPVRAGLLTIGGVALNEGDRVLLTAQTDPRQNLIYVAHVGGWTIAQDVGCQGGAGRLVPNSFLWVSEGTNADTLWTLTTDAPIVIGTTPLTWAMFAGSSGVTVRDNGVFVGTRPALNFKPGANITLTLVDDAIDNEVEITIAATGGTGDSLIFGADSVGGTTTTRYLYAGNSDSLAEVAPSFYVVPFAGTLRNLFVRQDDPAGNGNPIVYRVRVNTVATLLTVTLASTATLGSNLVNTVLVAQGDRIDVQVIKALSVGSPPRNVKATLEVA